MKRISLFLYSLTISFLVSAQVPKQQADTIIKKLDSLDRKADSAGFQNNNIHKEAYNEVTRLNGRDYLILLGSSIKQEFTKPFHMTRKDWGNLGKFAAVAVTAGFFDERIQKNALALRNKSEFIRNTGKSISQTGGFNEVYTLAAFGLYGIIVKSDKVKTTTLLATQAVITGSLVETVVKSLTGRTRPNYYGTLQEAEPTFKGPFDNVKKDANGNKTNSSFPSGHATVAFAAATVFAVEYKNIPVIPIVAYSIASLVSISRITENKHWTTDILAGAALGYITGRQVAFNYHRLAKIKNQQKAKRSISFNVQYSEWGKIMPGVVWHL